MRLRFQTQTSAPPAFIFFRIPSSIPLMNLTGILGAERARELERLVDDDRRRRLAVAHQLADRHAQDEAIEHRHALGPPPSRPCPQSRDRSPAADGPSPAPAPRQTSANSPGAGSASGHCETEERIERPGRSRTDQSRAGTGSAARASRARCRSALFMPGCARRGGLMTGPLVRRASRRQPPSRRQRRPLPPFVG